MLKYVILPRWLYDSAIAYKRDISDFLNFNISESILSPKELTFYIRCNCRTYDDFFINKNTNRLLKLLKSTDCENQISIQSDFINYIDGREKKLSNDTDFTEFLINNPLYLTKKDIDNRKLFLEARLVGTDILGFIPTTKEMDFKDYSIRRDIYDVMHRFMPVDEIIQSPIFGI